MAMLQAYCKTLSVFIQYKISEGFCRCAISLVTGNCCSLQFYSVQPKAKPAHLICIKNLDVKTGVGNDVIYQECLTTSERSCLGSTRT